MRDRFYLLIEKFHVKLGNLRFIEILKFFTIGTGTSMGEIICFSFNKSFSFNEWFHDFTHGRPIIYNNN